MTKKEQVADKAKVSDIKKIRKKRSRRALAKRTVVFSAVIVFIIAIVIAIESIGVANLEIWFSDFNSRFVGGDGYPIETEFGEITDIKTVGGNLAVITEENISVYNDAGGRIKNEHIGYKCAIVNESEDGSRLVVYDASGTGLKVESKSSVETERKFDSKIIAADRAKNKSIAVITEAERKLCEVAVYSKSGDEVFRWSSGDNYALAVSISDNGEKVAIGAFNLNGAEYSSRIICFSVKSGKELYRYEIGDRLILFMNLLSDGRVSLITEDKAMTVAADGKSATEYDYSGRDLVFWERESGKTEGKSALCFKDNGKYEVVIIEADSTEYKKEKLDVVKVSDMALFDSTLYVACSGGITAVDEDGARMVAEEKNIGGESLKIAVTGKYIYCLTSKGIERVEK